MSSETKTEKIENMEGAQELPKEPETTPAGLKVYPTSFLPAKSHIEPSRIPTAKMSGLTIEVSHVLIFVLLTVFLFLGMWKKSGHR